MARLNSSCALSHRSIQPLPDRRCQLRPSNFLFATSKAGRRAGRIDLILLELLHDMIRRVGKGTTRRQDLYGPSRN